MLWVYMVLETNCVRQPGVSCPRSFADNPGNIYKMVDNLCLRTSSQLKGSEAKWSNPQMLNSI